MKSVQSHPSAALLGVANKPPLTWELPQPNRPIALKVATLLDGKGGTLRDTVVVVSGDKIERIGGPVPQGAGPFSFAEAQPPRKSRLPMSTPLWRSTLYAVT